MQPEERDAAYLWDMLQAAKEVREMTAGHDLEKFLANRVLLRATERGVEIIGKPRGVYPQVLPQRIPKWLGDKLSGSAISWRMSMVRLTTNCSSKQ